MKNVSTPYVGASLFSVLLIFINSYSFAQTGVKISASAGTAHPSAMLDIESASRGLLVPRVNLVGLTNGTSPIASPATGLLVYNLGGGGVPAVGFYYWTGSAWVQLTAGGLSGAGTVNYVTKWTASNALGNSQLFDNGTNVGIGTTSPEEKLHVNGAVRIQNGILNTATDNLRIMSGVRANDDSYEWVGFYSGTTRQGIILYDGAWSGANGLTNEFSLSAEAGNLLTLNTQGSNIALMPKTGNVGVGTTSPSAKLDVEGEIRHNAVLKVDAAGETVWEASTRKYIIEAGPSSVGVARALNPAIINELCKDKDGCSVTLQMINWSTSQPGNIASRTYHLFISETTNWWRWANHDLAGLDGNGAVTELSVWDCYIGDFETSTGTSNQRADNGIGFGLLNCRGCSYSDVNVTCRVVVED